ncbi:unnamed protein product [Parnassius apollo]|uniref:Adenylyltransferase and sulfurtransferase MOCS3 homolog n=1 Tax=Parnassius apollo TaxID=110799 RepID=A0A8S3WM42_PARAO|nr:unnamed protein product [Parnassius apollo]
MDRIQKLEKEINSLRKALQEKESELFEMKSNWMPVHPNNNLNQGYTAQCEQLNMKNVTKVFYGDNLPKWAIERYSRQILLPDIGVQGQERLCAAKVLVVGAGGLGCPASVYLAGAGVGEIGIVDYDNVDLTNIHRQILHTERDQNMSKAESAAETLRSINSHIKITPYTVQLDSDNALGIASRYDVILDCSDNVPTRYLLNDVCAIAKIPLISGSALKMEGQLTVYGYRAERNHNEKDLSHQGPCYRCVFPNPPPAEAVGSCSANGVAGPVPGVIGALQALEAIKLIVGQTHEKLLVGRLLIFDGEDVSFRTVKLRPRNPQCAACSESPTITRLVDYEAFCKAQAKEKKKQEARLKTQRRREEKEKRMTGQSYYGFRTTKIPDGDKKKWIQDVPKSERKMGPRCKSEFCAKGTYRHCSSITEEGRAKLFHHFWNELDWKGKKNFVRSLVDTVPPKRRRLKHKGMVSRKGDTKLYHLKHQEERLPVCRVMFLNTLGIKEAMVRCWLIGEKPKLPKKPIKSLNVNSYIDNLPKAPARCQYCTDIQYINLDSIKNLYQLYNMYVRDMKAKGVVPASRKTFSNVATAKNIRIFKPKNDTDICDLDLDLQILSPEYRITALELEEQLKKLNLEVDSKQKQRHLLVDVRSEAEFNMCRIDGAVNYPIDQFRGEKVDEVLRMVNDKNQVTFVCRRGNDSQIAAKMVIDLIDEEHKDKVKDLVGGLHAWSDSVDGDFPIY